MSKQITRTVYTFDELSDRAKEHARDWWRQGMAEDQDWHDFTLEDAARMGELLGITFKPEKVPLYGGGTRYDPAIHYSGFCSQGDGASFEGSYAYPKDAPLAVETEAPEDTKLHQIARGLAEVQQAHGYGLTASIARDGYQRYSHEYTMQITVYDAEDNELDADSPATKGITEAMQSFARWIYRQLETEWEYQNSDEQVDEMITANEYTFDEDGNLEG